MHKLFILFIFCAALLTARAEGSVTRIEGTFDACYECCNATSNLRVAKKGVAVYYIDGKGHIQYDTYADSICGEQNGDAIHSDTFGMNLLDAFWPTPLAFNALKADSTATTPESTTLIFDMRARIDKDDAKIMRWIGASSEIKKWEIRCTYAGDDTSDICADSLRTITQTLDMTATGAIFSRAFDAPSTRCEMRVDIDVRDVRHLTTKQAKEARKNDKKQLADRRR